MTIKISYQDPGTANAVAWRIEMTEADDWHVHTRDGEVLMTTVAATARQFCRALIMPNLKPPVTTTMAAVDYRQRIREAVPEGVNFEPLMTLYLTDNLPPDEIKRAKDVGVMALKLYPAGATTNSDAGVTDIRKTYRTLEAMQREGMVLCLHGEVTDAKVDIFDREEVFIDQKLRPLRQDFPELKIVLEHITTKQAAQYVGAEKNIAATITAHHLLYNRNAIFQGGIRPHYYCLPVLKREVHREALLHAATSGRTNFFAGTDSAPHKADLKENECGCAGCYTAEDAVEMYVEAFESVDALGRLEGFMSHFGADFYRVPRNTDRIVIERESWTVPKEVPFGDGYLKPLRGGQEIRWKARRV
jgi:dihydroorotase